MAKAAFHVVVTYPGGRQTHHSAAPGGGMMSAEQLAEWYRDSGHFPGAESVMVHPTDEEVPEDLADLLKEVTKADPKIVGVPTIGVGKSIPTIPTIPGIAPNTSMKLQAHLASKAGKTGPSKIIQQGKAGPGPNSTASVALKPPGSPPPAVPGPGKVSPPSSGPSDQPEAKKP